MREKQNQLIQSNLKMKMFKCSISIKMLQHYFFTKVAVVVSSTVLGFTLLQVQENLVQAATITYDFTVDINVGPLSGSVGRGFLSYDNSLPILEFPSGTRLVASLFFDFDGNTFTLADDERGINNPSPVVFRDDLGSPSIGLYNFNVSGDLINFPGGGTNLLTNNTRMFGFDYENFYYTVENRPGVPEFYCDECITYTLREESTLDIPEPNPLGGLFLLSLGVFLKKKAKLRKAFSLLEAGSKEM